ncbi:MAG TPA: glycosyltransferase [Deltaproteobacteria bacterium]|nr:glycosyltransferase [Deltaproteobacteria bacterium]
MCAPKVSVVIPVYNGAAVIGRCIEALKDQDYPRRDYEIIAVDDGSTDATPRILDELGVRWARQPNAGPASARNRGARMASGDIILFIDSDCVALRNWISEMVRPFSDPQVAAVKGSYRTEQKGLTARFVQAEFEERYRLQERFRYIDFVDSYSAAFRRSVFLDSGGFDEGFPVADHEDVDLSYRLAALGHKMVFNRAAVVTHTHPDSPCRYFRTKMRRGWWRMVVYKRYPEKMARDTYTPQTLKAQILLVYAMAGSLAAAAFDAALLPLAAAAPVAFLATTVPFCLKTAAFDRGAALAAPAFLLLRASAFAIGVIGGVIAGRVRPAGGED